MKQFLIRRVLPVFLVVSLLVPSLVVPASAAANFPNSLVDTVSVGIWNGKLNCKDTSVLPAIAAYFGLVSATPTNVFWSMVNTTVYANDVGFVSEDELHRIADSYQRCFTVEMQYNFFQQIVDGNRALAGYTVASLFNLGTLNFEVRYDDEQGVYRILETTNNIWVVASDGTYPYYEEEAIDPNPQPGWVPVNDVYQNIIRGNGPGGSLYTQTRLENMMDRLVGKGEDCWISQIGGSGMMAIFKSGYVYCDENDRPYFYWKDSQAAIGQDRPTTDIVGDDGSTFEPPSDIDIGIDLENQFVLLPSGDTAITGEIIYDLSDHSYSVETYNFETNNFEYNYSFEYYVQYTYVTYIGETSDFDAYKCYYELPDGRNSADLTKEELEQLNVGIDVVEYSRSTDDVRLRALYHFDGNTRDSSYWNHLSDFEWSNAPSITYMESDPFGGALYLDGNVRSTLNFYLPTDLGSGDFTIQFRYYQGQKIEEDNYTGLYLNAVEDVAEWTPNRDDEAINLLAFNGEKFSYLDSEGEFFGIGEAYPVGSWFEICITRKGNVFTYYLNGQPLFVEDDLSGLVFNDRLTFYFYGGTVAYSMIDELRVLNFAIASGKESDYEPTAVPHDTNLALVLPNDKVAYADEYWTFESSHANLLEPYGLDDWTTMAYDPSAYLRSFDAKFGYQGDSWVLSHSWQPDDLTKLYAYYNSDVIDLDFSHQGAFFDYVYENSSNVQHLNGTLGLVGISYFLMPFASIYIPLSYNRECVLSDGDYIISVVSSSGDINSVHFSIVNGGLASATSSLQDGLVVAVGGYNSTFNYLAVGFNPKSQNVPASSIVYMELIRGTETDLTAEFHEDVAILDKDDQFKPTLAVRTDLEITDYQIGGVRPTIPEKGLVYAMVESGYITSLQIYNGQAWEACDGRIWTGERWIPYSSYNVITLQDMYDIVDATPGYEYIYTEAGFWAWWQRSWNEFTTKLFTLLGGGTGDDGDLDLPAPEADPENEDNLSFLEFVMLLINSGKSVLLGFRTLFSGVVSSVPGAVQVITGAFEPGGIAVGVFDGTYKDPDLEVVAVMDLDSLDYYQTEEVLDPWRYR